VHCDVAAKSTIGQPDRATRYDVRLGLKYDRPEYLTLLQLVPKAKVEARTATATVSCRRTEIQCVEMKRR